MPRNEDQTNGVTDASAPTPVVALDVHAARSPWDGLLPTDTCERLRACAQELDVPEEYALCIAVRELCLRLRADEASIGDE
jgi:hypothetical protein